MGAGWYVATERELPGQSGQLPHGGRALLFAQHHLEEIARLADVPPIKDFFSSDPASIAAYLRSQGVEKDPDELPEEEWYDAADVLPSIRRALAGLDPPPYGLAQLDKVREDLVAMSEILELAGRNSIRVHIATGFVDLNEREPA